MGRAVPWVAVGFVLGAVAGFQWGKTAKSNIGKAVSTDYSGGVATVQFDVYQAARSGLGDTLNGWLGG